MALYFFLSPQMDRSLGQPRGLAWSYTKGTYFQYDFTATTPIPNNEFPDNCLVTVEAEPDDLEFLYYPGGRKGVVSGHSIVAAFQEARRYTEQVLKTVKSVKGCKCLAGMRERSLSRRSSSRLQQIGGALSVATTPEEAACLLYLWRRVARRGH